MGKRIILILTVIIAITPVFSNNIFADKGYKLNEKGNRDFLNKDYNSAINKYIRALSERDNPVIKYNLANSMYQKGDYKKAIDIYRKIEKEIPDNLKPDLYYNLGNAFFKGKQYEKAIENYIKYLRIKPKDKYAKENLELAMKMLKQQKQNQNKKDKQNNKKDKDKNKNKEQDNNKNKDKKNKNKNKERKNKDEQKRKSNELQKLLKTLAEQEKIDRKKNMKNKQRQKAVIDSLGKDW